MVLLRRLPGRTILALVAPLIACGCAENNSAATAPQASPPPTLSELPNLATADQRMPVRVGVEGADAGRPVRRIVPAFEPVKPTPAEQAILGDPPPEEQVDRLAFYKPLTGNLRKVSTDFAGPTAAVSGSAGPTLGQAPAPRFITIYGFSGPVIAADPRAAGVAAADPRDRRQPGQVSKTREEVTTGVDRESKVADKAPRAGD